MADSHVVSGLKAKHAEISGQIEATQRALRDLVIDLDHIEASLRILDPDIDLRGIRPRPAMMAYGAFRGALMRLILDALRDAKKPITTKDIARHVMIGRGLNPGDERVQRIMIRRVGGCLVKMRKKGFARSRPGSDAWLLWERT